LKQGKFSNQLIKLSKR